MLNGFSCLINKVIFDCLTSQALYCELLNNTINTALAASLTEHF
jgi:hypothetical protein